MHVEYKLKSNQQKESQIPFPNKIKVDIEIKTIAEKFSTFFTDIDPKSASKNHQLIDQYLQSISVASSLLKKSNH